MCQCATIRLDQITACSKVALAPVIFAAMCFSKMMQQRSQLALGHSAHSSTAAGAAQLARHTPKESTAEKEEEEGRRTPSRDTHDEFMLLLLGSKKRV